ncbi:MAG: phage head-tail connector protein [Candidatus Rokubacteria bacterium]|nr:phage head-tail connector protein [Candidatus Rokubacteria bacterium]
MAVAANALVSLTDAKSFLGIIGTADDAKLEKVIDRASDLCEQYCRRPFKELTYTDLRRRGPNGRLLYPLHVPIKASGTITISVDGTAQSLWKAEADGDPALKDVIVASDLWDSLFSPNHFYRAAGWAALSTSNPYNVLLTYTGGFVTIPDDLQEGALEIIQKLWRDQSKAVQEVVSINTPGGGITLLDTVIPKRAALLLNVYRRIVVV